MAARTGMRSASSVALAAVLAVALDAALAAVLAAALAATSACSHPRSGFCDAEQGCPSGQVCELSTFTCVPRPDAAPPDSRPAPDRGGDSWDGSLPPGGCASDSDCRGGTRCVLGLGRCYGLSPGTFELPGEAVAVSLGDVDRDGCDDLAALPRDGNQVNIRLGNCDGSFRADPDFTAAVTSPQLVALEDVDRDGLLDLLVANFEPADGNQPAYGSLAIRQGESGVCPGGAPFCFKPAVQRPLGATAPSALRVHYAGETPGTYIVIGSSQDKSVPASLHIMCWKNSPGGLKRVELAATAADLAIGDLDADGKPDLTIAHPGGVLCKAIGDPGSVGIYLGKDGIFDDSPAPPGPFPASLSLTGQVNPRSVDLGDLDGDGQPELLAVANNQSADVSVLLYDRRRAAFGPKVSYAAGQYPYVVRAREVNGDGRLDLVVANDQGNRVRVLLGDGSGRFFAAPGTVVEDVALPVPLANALDPLLASLAVGRLVPQGEAGAPADIVVSSVSAYDCKLAKQAPDPRLVVWLGVRP